MKEIQQGQLPIFRLYGDEFENAAYKNECLCNAKTDYIAYVKGDSVEDSELLRVCQQLQEADDVTVAVFCRGRQEEQLDYAGVFGLLSDSIDALIFSKELIRKTGSFNGKLRAQTNFELLCRMIRETDSCMLMETEEKTNAENEMVDTEAEKTDDRAYTCAYIIRQHLQQLHALGLMEQVFTFFSETMQKEGLFSVFQKNVNFFMSDEKEYEKIARQTAPFIVLRGGDTCGGVLRQFAYDLCDGLAETGQAVIKLDESFQEYEKIQNIVCKGIVGFQAPALEIDFFKNMCGPKFQFWFDYPLHSEKMLRNLSQEYYILCQDDNYASLIREYYYTPNAIQFPPAGRERKSGRQERVYDIAFVGSFFEDECDSLTGEERVFYDYMLAHPQLTFEQGLRELLAEKGETIEDETFVNKLISMKSARRGVIGHFRNEVISTILEAGFTLHVYGDSWKDYQGARREHLVIHPQVTVEESLDELSKAKIGLNIMSWHKAGMTERVANIMLSGAVCLTEETTYLRENMKDGEEIVCFQLDRLSELPGQIAWLLDHPEERERIADNAYQKASAEHTWKCRARQLVDLAEKEKKDNIGIFVATHVKFNPPKNPIYIPLHVGRSGKQDLGYLGDDTGENISDLNFLYGELTGLFWIWQNIDNLDYVGLCHYRRYFINAEKDVMREQEYLEILEQYDAIVPKHAECEGTYYQHFGKAHNSRDLDAVERALKRIYPEYADAFDRAMESSIYYWGNLIVTSLPVLKAYAEWLFNIFVEASEEIDVSGYDDYHKRVYGFLSEQMFYVFALTNNLSCCEVMAGFSGEKAETKALKEQLKCLLADNRREDAARLFDQSLKKRPDLLLPGSDINGELQKIYKELLGEM